jgi:hypothetical protein
MPRPCHAMTFWKWLLKAKAKGGMCVAWHGWISIGRPETACGQPARVRLLLATMQSSTKVVIRSIPICQTARLAVRMFPATMRTFTRDMALSENGTSVTRHVWISLKGQRVQRHSTMIVPWRWSLQLSMIFPLVYKRVAKYHFSCRPSQNFSKMLYHTQSCKF